MSHAVNVTVVYIDETNFRLYTRRARGRAVQGHRAVRQVLGSPGPNLNLVMAISPGVGVLYYEMFHGSMTAIRFGHFLDNLAVTLEDTDAFIIMDNAPGHGGTEMNNPRHVIKK